MYQGRFAPSPSGRLHGGSLLTGLSATLRAISQQGHCLTRIEDLDFPRCDPALTPLMLQELALLGLFPFNLAQDNSRPELAIQSHELAVYQDVVGRLYNGKIAFCCDCSRADLKQRPCICASKEIGLGQQLMLKSSEEAHAIALSTLNYPLQKNQTDLEQLLKNSDELTELPKITSNCHFDSDYEHSALGLVSILAAQEQYTLRIELKKYLKSPQYASFHDELLGKVTQPTDHSLASSLVIQRRDGIIAYNLAVVVDEQRQSITEVVRGADLLETTFLQLALYEILDFTPPKFLHIPLLVDAAGNKLSKQNHAPAILGQLLPHQATLQAALQLKQELSPHSIEIAHTMQLLARQASLCIFNHLKACTKDSNDANAVNANAVDTNFVDLAALGQDYRHAQGLTQLNLEPLPSRLSTNCSSPESSTVLVQSYLNLCLTAIAESAQLDSLIQHHIHSLPPCYDLQRGTIELEPTMFSWDKVSSLVPALKEQDALQLASLHNELSCVLKDYLSLQRDLVKQLGQDFNMQVIPRHPLH